MLALEGGCGCAAPSTASMWRWARIGFSAVVAVNSMAVAIAVNTSPDLQSNPQPVRLGLLLSTVLVAALVGTPLARGAWVALKERRLAVEALFALTLAGAFGVSLQSLVTGNGPVYFEVVSILLVVYSFGAEMNRAARNRAVEAIRKLSASERVARVRMTSGGVEQRVAGEVQLGDVVEVLPGEMVPVDGVLLGEAAMFEEATLRGEFVPCTRVPGENVMAGSFVLDAQIQILARALPDDSSLDSLLCEVGNGMDTKTASQHAADRLARWFVPVVSVTAVGSFVGWTFFVPVSEALFHAMAVLLVACPCALGFATPLALWTATSRLRAIGIRVSRAADVEALSAVDLVAFDKTGTLSAAETRLTQISWSEAIPYSAAEMLAMVVAAERGLMHPFARAIERSGIDAATSDAALEWRRTALRILPGKGIWARMQSRNGRSHEVELLADTSEANATPLGAMPMPGDEGIVIWVDGIAVGSAAFEEEFREGHKAALAELAQMGVDLQLLSGDSSSRALRAGIAAVQGKLSPMDKREQVRGWQSEKRTVLFVGDGINDAPAMAAADMAIAVDEGTALARAVAGSVWDGRSLLAIPAALQISRQTLRRVRANFRWAIGYNAIGMVLAAAGFLHPVSAALLMVASSAQVTWRAMALLGETKFDGLAEASQDWKYPVPRPRLVRNTELATSGHSSR